MKKVLIPLVIILLVLAVLFYFREPIIDFLPIDQSGWEIREGRHYYLDEDGDPRTGWFQVDGIQYYFREDGVLHTGWLDQDQGRYYFSESGGMVTGWHNTEGHRRYFGSDGKLFSGLLEEKDKRYFLDENGLPIPGFHQVKDRFCYISQDGKILSGWLHLEEGSYYLDEGGAVHIGWLEEDGARYFFTMDGGKLATGWLEDGGQRYFLSEADGHMVTGWLNSEVGTYYMHTDGTLATGLTEIEGVYYLFDESGAPSEGWAEVEGVRHYFGEDGNFHSGWLEENGLKYYLLEDGTPAVGKLVIEDRTYFFSSTGMNFILVNPWNSLPEDFEVEIVEASGTWLNPVCQEALEQMLADCREAGFYPQIVSGYRSVADQTANLQNMINSYLDQGYSYGQAYSVSTQIVAVPGTSEHHLGLAFDIVDAGYPKLTHEQAQMPTQQWLMENCWKYGFIMRYPEGSTAITGIIYEPWHYRYVGLELAKEIHELGNITLEEYIDNLTADGTTCGGKASADE